ncbi:MAG: CRISPR-associated protein Cas5 [Bacillota bacterium]|nr:CRISPR-associated protein Cas5 [Bacillota bacterium]
MLCLYVQAPFAAFRHFSAGSFRQTADFVTHSAAYGLLLNVAGIEMRRCDLALPITLIQEGLPHFKMAIGALELPVRHSLFQQLHNYPVGNSGEELKAGARGSKYNIAPAVRTFLSGLKCYICIEGDNDFEEQLQLGLQGKAERSYGLLFLGDNNYLLDRFEIAAVPNCAHWFVRLDQHALNQMPDNVTRLTTKIDRVDMSETKSDLFMPHYCQDSSIPDSAWVEMGY